MHLPRSCQSNVSIVRSNILRTRQKQCTTHGLDHWGELSHFNIRSAGSRMRFLNTIDVSFPPGTPDNGQVRVLLDPYCIASILCGVCMSGVWPDTLDSADDCRVFVLISRILFSAILLHFLPAPSKLLGDRIDTSGDINRLEITIPTFFFQLQVPDGGGFIPNWSAISGEMWLHDYYYSLQQFYRIGFYMFSHLRTGVVRVLSMYNRLIDLYDLLFFLSPQTSFECPNYTTGRIQWVRTA